MWPAHNQVQHNSLVLIADAGPAARPLLQSMHVASDGTRKIVYSLHGDEGASGTVETVLIPMTNKAGQNMRYTACVSSQVWLRGIIVNQVPLLQS